MEHKCKCPNCGFEYVEKPILPTDFDDCVKWSVKYFLDKSCPTKEQFEAMQRMGFLPTRKKYGAWHGPSLQGKSFELTYGHYGWGVDYDWNAIAQEIGAANFHHVPVPA